MGDWDRRLFHFCTLRVDREMKYDPYDHNILLVGDGGSGKSNFIRDFLHNLPPAVVWWLWDYNHQHRFVRTVSAVDQLYYEKTVIQPANANEQEFIKFCEKADRVGNIVVAIEEIQEFITPHKLVAEAMFRTGRNRGTTWIAMTQRPAEINSSLVSNSAHRIAFRLTHPNDIKFLSKWISPEMEAAKNLPPFYYLYHTKLSANPPVVCSPVPRVDSI